MGVDYRLLQHWLDGQRRHAEVRDLARWRNSVARASAHLAGRRAELAELADERQPVPLRWQGPSRR